MSDISTIIDQAVTQALESAAEEIAEYANDNDIEIADAIDAVEDHYFGGDQDTVVDTLNQHL